MALVDIQPWKGLLGPNTLRAFVYLRPQRGKLWIIAAVAVT